MPPRSSKFDLYPKSRDKFSLDLFLDPSAEYRGCPLWSWNTELHKPLLRREIHALKEMGIGGFTMHARVGLDTPYLGDKYLDCVAACVAEARKLNMKAYLYDEDRWPSGAAGGLVTRDDPSTRMLHLLFTPWKYGTEGHGPDGGLSSGGNSFRGESGSLLGRYAISLDESGYMSYRRMQSEDHNQPSDVLLPGERIWYAYIESNPPSTWYNNAWYIDSLSPRAMRAFIDKTHEVYLAKAGVGDEFGKTLTAIFTDEPQFAGMTQLERPDEEKDLFMPWTEGLEKSFLDSTGLDLVAALPELFWDLAPTHSGNKLQQLPSLVKYHFHDHVAELFASAFLDQLSEWCEDHSLAQMGHMNEEPTLLQQTQCLGDAMRTYRSMQLPGVDMLVDSREWNTVKQCSSVVRQYGRTGCMSELYGVTNWTYSFKDYHGQGNWQAALGVTLRSHHLSWVSMNGEAKRDYPAQIGYQSPWYKEYGFVEDHFARVAVTLSRGKARTRVAVLHPIESFWLRYGCKATAKDQGSRDQWFNELTEWLLFGLLDFDFLAESLLPELVDEATCPIRVGHASYETIILPHCLTLRSTTIEILERFAELGGTILVAGGDASYVDAIPSSRPSQLKATRISFDQASITRQLARLRDIDISEKKSKKRTDQLLYQWRDDGEEAFVFITNTDRDVAHDCHVDIRGSWHVTILDTLLGKSTPMEITSSTKSSQTSFDWRFEGCACLMLHLKPKDKGDRADASTHLDSVSESVTAIESVHSWSVSKHVKEPKYAKLDEPNALLLDFCRYRTDKNKEWSELDEILRIDGQVRDELGMHRRGDAMAQPWITPRPRPKPKHKVYVSYQFETSIPLTDAELALEGAESTIVRIDNEFVPTQDISDYWVDQSITRVPLPRLLPGSHEIILEIPFDELNTSMERIFILGDFDVTLDQEAEKGRAAKITSSPKKALGFGDYTKRGLPFYTGNVTYGIDLTGTGERTAIQIPEIGINPVLAVSVNGESVGRIGLPPYRLDLGVLKRDEVYAVEVTAYGNRDHCHGAVHAPEGSLGNYGPGAWRTSGDGWSDGYTIRHMGILDGIKVLIAKNKSQDELEGIMNLKVVE